jgi:type I restriction enzyme M protein
VTSTVTNNTDLARAEILWKSADALRGQIDAAEYKHVVLGLLFLKYISDSFAARRDELAAELQADGITGPQLEGLLESRDEYTAERVFRCAPWRAKRGRVVPGRRRRERIAAVAKGR